jgi:hypothetical protein
MNTTGQQTQEEDEEKNQWRWSKSREERGKNLCLAGHCMKGEKGDVQHCSYTDYRVSYHSATSC